MVGCNAKHEAPHAWTNGFLGVGSRLGAGVVYQLNFSLEADGLRTHCLDRCSILECGSVLAHSMGSHHI